MTTITFHSDNTSRQRRAAMMFGLLRVAAGINILALVGVCVFLLWNGSPAISWEFLTEPPRRMMTAGGVWPCIVGTFLLAFGAMLIAFPLGVASATNTAEKDGTPVTCGSASATSRACLPWCSGCSGWRSS